MAEETPISSLDSLGPQYGGINRPNLDTQSLQPFEGDITPTPEINFPKAKTYYPSILGTDSLTRPDERIRSYVGTPPKKPGATTKENYNPRAFGDAVRAAVISNQSQNEYAKAYAYDASPSGNAFYKRYAAYGQKKFDEIGFSPIRDNEALFNSGTSKWDDFSRMMNNSFVPLFSRGFVSGPKSLGRMLQGDFSSDIEDARAYEEAAAIGQSTKGGVFGFVNNTAMNFAYTAGIMTEAILEELGAALLTVATGGGAAPVLFASTANAGKNILRGVKGLETAFDASKAVNQTLKSLDNASTARNFWNSARSTTKAGLNTKVGQFLNPIENITSAAGKIMDNADNLSGLARLTSATRTGFGGFYRDVRSINMALSEARLEGGFVENTVYDKLYDEFYERNGKAPSDDEQKLLLNTAKEAGMETLFWNTALIYGSNKITIPNIVGPKGAFAGGLKGKIDDVLQLKGGKVVFEKVKDASSKITKGDFKFVEDSFINTVKAFKKEPIRKALLGAAGYMKANITEGLQENAQEVIAGAYENYYIHNSLKNQGVGSHQYNKGLNAYLMEESFGQMSGKGFETFASGFFMGMFGSGFNAASRSLQWGYNKTFNKEEAAKYTELRNTYGKGIAEKLNNLYSDPKAFFNSREFNYGVQFGASGNKEDMNEKEIKDQANEAFISQVYTALDTNTMSYFTDHLDSMKNLSAEEFEEAFGFEKGTGAEYQGRIDGILSKAADIEKSYKEINERFPSPVDMSKISKDNPDYEAAAILDSAWSMAKRQAIFSNETFKDVTSRMDSIYKTISDEPSLAKMSSSDLQNLFEIPKMNDELGLLKDEIEMFEQSGSKDPKLKADIDFKKKKAKALDDYLNKFIKYNNYYQRGQYKGPARKVLAEELGIDESEVTDKQINERLNQEIGEMTDDRSIAIDSELETSYKEYLKTIADFNDTQLFTRDIDKAFIKLKDYYNLKRESRELAKHINIFSDPQGYFNMVKRNTEWMSNVYNNRKKYFDEMVDAQLKAKEHNDLLNALANQNIYVDLEEFQNFIDNGIYPTKFYNGAGKVITQNHPKYREIIEMFNLLVEMQNSKSGLADQGLDAELQAKIDVLNKKMQDEIDNLAKYEQRVNKETLSPEKDKPLKLSSISENMPVNSYVELQYGEEGYITFFKDEEGNIRFDDKDGDIVDIKSDNTSYLQGVLYAIEMQPDSQLVEEIQKRYAELIAKLYEETAAKKEIIESDFKVISQNTPLSEMPDELIKSLQSAFQTEVLDVMDEETQAGFTDEQIMKMFTDFITESPVSLKIIDEYNVKSRAEFATKRLGEKEDFTFKYKDQNIDSSTLTIPQLRDYVLTFIDLKNKLETKADPSSEDTILLNSYKIVINDLEALIRTRSLKQMSPSLQEAKRKLDKLLSEQEKIELTPNGYVINDILHQRVTTAIQGLKNKVYSYADEKTIRLEFYKIFTNQEINDTSINEYIQVLRDQVPQLKGFSEFTFTELENELKEVSKNDQTNEELLEIILKTVREKTFEGSRISGNYIDNQIKKLFNNEPVVFNADNITQEAFDNLFSQEIDDKTGLPKGYLAQIKGRVDSGELYILSQGLRVFDTDLQIAGEIDLIVADQNGNISIVDVKTGNKNKWDKWKGTAAYEKTVQENERKIQKIEQDFNDGVITEEEKFTKLDAVVNYAALKVEDYELQQTAYANLLYRMTGIDAIVGLLPVEVTFNEETGQILTANKPSSPALKPGKFTIGLTKAEVQDRINSIIPKVYEGLIEEPTAMKVGTDLSVATRAKLNKLGITDPIISLMTKEEIDEAKGYFDVADAQEIIDKYKDLAQEPEVQDDVSDLDTSLQDELLKRRMEVDAFIQQKIDKYNLPTFDLFSEITNSQITVIEKAKAGLPVDLISLKEATDYLYKIVKDIEALKKNDQARIDYNLTTEYLDAVYQDLTIDITYLVDYETAYKSGESLPTFEYPAESPVTEDEFRTETTTSKGVTTETPQKVNQLTADIERRREETLAQIYSAKEIGYDGEEITVYKNKQFGEEDFWVSENQLKKYINNLFDTELADLEGETVSSLTFRYTIDSIKTSLEDINDIDVLNKYRAELNGQVTLGNIPAELIPQISTMVKAKLAELETRTSIDANAITIEKGNTLIAKSDIFINNLMFAPAGGILTVIKIDNTKKIAKLKYGNKTGDFTFDEIETNTTTMEAINNQIEPETAPLVQEDKDKVVISNDLTDIFINTEGAVEEAINEAKNVDDIQDLEDSLLNNLEC
jgi:Holliday junction resolvase-like predicted endonuclease